MNRAFADHFSAAAADYAQARLEYPLFEWIASMARARARVREAGCGSGQASRGLAKAFEHVFATDPRAAQIEQAHGSPNIMFAVEPAERCSLPDASVDAVCVAQALHWFDRGAFFAECARVLKPGGVLVAWGYQDIDPPQRLLSAVVAFRDEIEPYWPPERAFIDAAYAQFEWPFEDVRAPEFQMAANWPLPRLVGYFSSFSAVKNDRDATGSDPVAVHAAAIAAAWGDAQTWWRLRWPIFVHARHHEQARGRPGIL